MPGVESALRDAGICRRESSRPQTTANVTSTHATRPVARTVYHQSSWFTA